MVMMPAGLRTTGLGGESGVWAESCGVEKVGVGVLETFWKSVHPPQS